MQKPSHNGTSNERRRHAGGVVLTPKKRRSKKAASVQRRTAVSTTVYLSRTFADLQRHASSGMVALRLATHEFALGSAASIVRLTTSSAAFAASAHRRVVRPAGCRVAVAARLISRTTKRTATNLSLAVVHTASRPVAAAHHAFQRGSARVQNAWEAELAQCGGCQG